MKLAGPALRRRLRLELEARLEAALMLAHVGELGDGRGLSRPSRG